MPAAERFSGYDVCASEAMSRAQIQERTTVEQRKHWIRARIRHGVATCVVADFSTGSFRPAADQPHRCLEAHIRSVAVVCQGLPERGNRSTDSFR